MKISNLLTIVALPVLVLGSQAGSRAQENLVNLYDWTPETRYGSSPDSGITISDSESAIFYGSYSTNVFSGPDHIIPALAGDISTMPAGTYEISYTLAHDGSFSYCNGTLSFGGFNYEIHLPFGVDSNAPPHSLVSENFNFLVTATASSTPMSFVWSAIDNGDAAFLTSLSVTAVPENSTMSLLFLGGGVWLLASFWRRFSKPPQNEIPDASRS